jgi:DNA helicase HerA-like ATPase
MAFNEHEAPVGVTKGPGETPHEYTFISRDEARILKTGEYVWYALDDGGEQEQRVLGRITQRRAVQQYPDTFLAEPMVAPSQVASLLGYEGGEDDLFELTVGILGYYAPLLGTFINPWISPPSGRPIYLASDALLASVLSKLQVGEQGSAHIGDLLTRGPGAVPVVIDVKEMASTHLAIIASTGAGKSYLAGVIVEELMRAYNRAAVLVIDPHGEYNTLSDIMNLTDRFGASASDGQRAYRPEVRVFRHDQVKVRISTLELGDLRYLLTDMTEKQHYLLTRGWRTMHEKKRTAYWTAQDLKEAIRESAGGEGGERDDSGTVGALEWKIENRFVENNMTFDDSSHLPLGELCTPGRCTVLQLNETDERDQQVIVATVLRRLYQARMKTVRSKVHPGDEEYLPYPVFVLVEEAHHFAPAGGDVISSRVLKQALAEGRKFGVGVGLISQRPGKIDPDVLSQCQTQCIMRIVNEIDQHAVATAVETVGRELLQNLPALTKGQVIIAGSAVNTPVLCRVRPRLTTHGGESHNAPQQWRDYFSDDAAGDRLRDSALLMRQAAPARLLRGTRK